MEGWEKAKIASRCYPLGSKDQELLDKTFDELHAQGQMEWVRTLTSFVSPVFVVWQTVNGVKKGRVAVNLRALNKVAVSDAYHMTLQSDIIEALREVAYISVIDGSSFFYQF